MKRLELVFDGGHLSLDDSKKLLNDISRDTLLSILKNAHKIYIIGDGGSASMADHFAQDLLKGMFLPAISLCSNQAMITAIGNDCGFDQTYELQLRVLFQKGDVLICLSTSGESPNIVRAASYVQKTHKGTVISLTKNTDNKLRQYSDIHIALPTTDIQECEDMMSIFCHILCKSNHL